MKIAILAPLAVAALAGVANADFLYSTNFNAPTYTNAGLIGQDGWLITGTSVVNPLTVSNTGTNGVVTLAATGQDANHTYAARTSGSVYLTLDINFTAANATGDYFIHLGDGGTSNFYSRIYARTVTGGFQLAMGTSAGTTGLVYGAALSFGTTYTIMARYDFVPGLLNDTGALFVNPLDPMGAGDTPYVAALTVGTDATTISSVNIRQGSTGPVGTIDNLNVVPTPGSAALLSVGILAAGRRRRA